MEKYLMEVIEVLKEISNTLNKPNYNTLISIGTGAIIALLTVFLTHLFDTHKFKKDQQEKMEVEIFIKVNHDLKSFREEFDKKHGKFFDDLYLWNTFIMDNNKHIDAISKNEPLLNLDSFKDELIKKNVPLVKSLEERTVYILELQNQIKNILDYFKETHPVYKNLNILLDKLTERRVATFETSTSVRLTPFTSNFKDSFIASYDKLKDCQFTFNDEMNTLFQEILNATQMEKVTSKLGFY